LPNLWWSASYGSLIMGIFLMHYFCWVLGLLYRQKHEQFPWVLQRHVKTLHPQERMAMLAAKQAEKKAQREANRQMRRMNGRL
jgi:TctA family transporter